MMGDRSDQVGGWEVTYSYDRSEESPSEIVARAVASTTDQSVTSIDPLYSAVEPDALDEFVGGRGRDSDVSASFAFEGCQVYVDGGSVAVSRVADEDE